ncbi:hypothetical protein CDD82_3581 [Ophiocordyceps australis]|uniref:Pyoverdine/dityrosine biosynthesis protein n=1 Tax=Ophiocordyceps australis TaxID=1399860 RepID=A0A2C5ZB92_9HYPO|nr:hypothetical protein CDD82_3581 [Ophiocordyceps australis]
MARQNFFTRHLASYIRSFDGSLLHCQGGAKHAVEAIWHHVQGKLPSAEQELRGVGEPLRIDVMEELKSSLHGDEADRLSAGCVMLYERVKIPGKEILGVVVLGADDAGLGHGQLDDFYAFLSLSGVEMDVQTQGEALHDDEKTVDVNDAIVDHFDASLRYVTQDDLWEAQGRDYFRRRVEYFTSRGEQIRLCLPAFPCKSSNLNKVQGTGPDRGEYIALTNLHRFIEGIEAIYPPGGKLWIISDGHVFSDCIGVDDDLVDDYGARLIAMNDAISKSRGGIGRVGFKSLLDLFHLDAWQRQGHEAAADLPIGQITHHIPTKLEEQAELCRRILVFGFQPESQELRQQIDNKDAVMLPLYRGFSRFMLEDLEVNCYTKDLSRSQRRRLASKVAFEMIQRNQAYSNLVELMFPHHVRLSIHAHPNCGPKFGIQVFGPGVKPTNQLSRDGDLMTSNDLLHVPTPWHNCVVEIENHATLYVTKSAIARSAVTRAQFDGGWTGAAAHHGGCFQFSVAPPKPRTESKSAAIAYVMPVYGVVGETATMAEVGCV